ncbi:MAG TPA: pilus assembly protein PilM, partial [Patescibacteria group bacterium]|nr:pilus assembly protein PilM [Patescibacteria group bacterium]
MFGRLQQAFGLDISDQAIRLINCRKIGKKNIITNFNELAVPANVINNGEIIEPQTLSKLIQQLVKSTAGPKIKTKNVISVLPETKTFIKVLTLNAAIDKKNIDHVAALIEKEIVNHLPVSPDEIYFDWQLLETKSDSAKVLVGAAPRNIVDSYLSVLEKSDLTVYALEIEAAALSRSLLAEKEESAKILIDFGAIRTGLTIYDKNTIQFTVSLPISGNK